jgi:MFS family permease
MNESRDARGSERAVGESRPFAMLVPIMVVVLSAFLIIGVALPVLPLHVNHGLGLGTFVVGLVAGSQFAASLISRVWSGVYADTRGAKGAVVVGLLTATAGGILYLLSLGFVGTPRVSVSILLVGRALLGGAESFIMTGALSWGLALVGAQSAGKVIAWVGTAMFAALAVGAPIGTALYGIGGFAAVGLATTLVPLVALLFAAPLSAVPPQGGHRPSLTTVAGAVWMPGLGAALSSIGFGAILAFSALLFADRGWLPVWLPFSAFATSLIVARVMFGKLPDLLGGARSRARLRIRRSSWSRTHLVGASRNMGGCRSGAHGDWLFSGVPRVRCRGCTPRAATESRSRNGGLHRLSRRGARAWQPGAGAHCRFGRPGRGFSRERSRGPGRRPHRAPPALETTPELTASSVAPVASR